MNLSTVKDMEIVKNKTPKVVSVGCVGLWKHYFSPIHIPFLLPPYPLSLSTPATQAKFIVVSGRKDGVDLVLIYRYVVIFIARFG